MRNIRPDLLKFFEGKDEGMSHQHPKKTYVLKGELGEL